MKEAEKNTKRNKILHIVQDKFWIGSVRDRIEVSLKRQSVKQLRSPKVRIYGEKLGRRLDAD
jgi:hypothetical protein